MTVFNEAALRALENALSTKGKWVLAFLSEQPGKVKKEAIKDGTNIFYKEQRDTQELIFNSRKTFDDNIERLEGAALIDCTVDLGRAKMYYLTEGGQEMLKHLERKGNSND